MEANIPAPFHKYVIQADASPKNSIPPKAGLQDMLFLLLAFALFFTEESKETT